MVKFDHWQFILWHIKIADIMGFMASEPSTSGGMTHEQAVELANKISAFRLPSWQFLRLVQQSTGND